MRRYRSELNRYKSMPSQRLCSDGEGQTISKRNKLIIDSIKGSVNNREEAGAGIGHAGKRGCSFKKGGQRKGVFSKDLKVRGAS